VTSRGFLKARKISAFFKIERSTRDKGFPSLDVFSRFDRPFQLMFRVLHCFLVCSFDGASVLAVRRKLSWDCQATVRMYG
jgi:hypothetical protein